MILDFESLSALLPSQYREFMKKGWNKKRLNPLFKKYGDPRGYRIYLSFGDMELPKVVDVNIEIDSALRKQGVVIEDYVKGIGKDQHGRLVRIGKLLNKEPELKQIFDNDARRKGHKLKNLMVVISRHPYDIAGMSTNRDWTSCMNLTGGVYKDKIPDEIAVGTMVAYLINAKDANINKPIARTLLKPFKSGRKTYYGVEKTYPHGFDQFRRFVTKWVDKHINLAKAPAIADINTESYNDGLSRIAVGYATPEGIERMNTDVDFADAAVRQDPDAVLNLSSEMFGNVILTALYNGLTVESLLKVKDRLQTLDEMDRNTIARRYPVLMPYCYPEETLSTGTLIELVKGDDSVVKHVKYYLDTVPNLEKTPIVTQMLLNVKSDSAIDYIMEVYGDFVDADSLLASSAAPANKMLFKRVGITSDRKLALKSISRFGLSIFIGNPRELATTFDLDDLDDLDSLSDSISDKVYNIKKSGKDAEFHKAFPPQIVSAYPELIKYVYSTYDTGIISCLTYLDGMPSYSRYGDQFIDLIAECLEEDSSPEVYKDIKINQSYIAKDFATKLYNRIGIEHMFAPLNFSVLPPDLIVRGIRADLKPPYILTNTAFFMPPYLAEDIGEELNKSAEPISDRWLSVLATRGCTFSLFAARYLFDNRGLLRQIPDSVNVWGLLDHVRALVRRYDYKQLSITTEEYDEFEKEARSILL